MKNDDCGFFVYWVREVIKCESRFEWEEWFSVGDFFYEELCVFGRRNNGICILIFGELALFRLLGGFGGYLRFDCF